MIARVGDDMFGEATIQNFKSCEHRYQPCFDDARSVHRRRADFRRQRRAESHPGGEGCERSLIARGCLCRKGRHFIRGYGGASSLEIPLLTTITACNSPENTAFRPSSIPRQRRFWISQEIGFADYVIPNETEAEVSAGCRCAIVDEARECVRCLATGGLNRVIMTLGANGALFGDQHVAPLPSNRWIPPARATPSSEAWRCSFQAVTANWKPSPAPIFMPRLSTLSDRYSEIVRQCGALQCRVAAPIRMSPVA